MRQSGGYRRGMILVAVVAAALLGVRGVMELRQGTGWPLLLVAAAIVAAIIARTAFFRDGR